MKILYKHVTREILVPFVLVLVVMTFLSLVGNLLQELAERFTSAGLNVADLGMIMVYGLPLLTTYTIPIALLFATLAAYVQLSQDCEIIAMKAAGLPSRRIFAPAVMIGVVTTIILLPLCVEISPWSRRELKLFIIQMVLEKPTLMLTEQEWTPEVNGMRIFVGEIDEKNMTLKDVSVMVSEKDKPQRTIVAESGRIDVDTESDTISLQLFEGSIHEFDSDNPEEYSTVMFSNLKIPVSIGSIERYIDYNERYEGAGSIPKKEMSLTELIHEIKNAGDNEQNRRDLVAQIAKRTAVAFMPLTFVLIGAPLGIIPYKSRRFYGLAVCGLLLVIYYALLMLSESLSKRDILPPLLAMWVPNMLLGLTGVALIFRAERH